MAMINPPDSIEFPTPAAIAYAWLRSIESQRSDHDDHQACLAAVHAALADPDDCRSLFGLLVDDAAARLRQHQCPCGRCEPGEGFHSIQFWDPVTGEVVPIEAAMPDPTARLAFQAVFAAGNDDDPDPFIDQMDLTRTADRSTAIRSVVLLRRLFHSPTPPGDPT